MRLTVAAASGVPSSSTTTAGSACPPTNRPPARANAELAETLTRIAHEEGAGGISLECVDYNNYRPATREVLSSLTKGDCRFIRKRLQ